MNRTILSAVQERRRIRFWYDNEFRTVEPHCYGSSASGTESLIGFQVGSNAWRWFHVPWMTRVSLMSETFEPRPDYVTEQPGVEVVYAEVEPSPVMSIRKEKAARP